MPSTTSAQLSTDPPWHDHQPDNTGYFLRTDMTKLTKNIFGNGRQNIV